MSHVGFARAGRRIRRDLSRAVSAGVLNTNTVKFHYQESTGGENSRYNERAATMTYGNKWLEFQALVHFVQPLETGLRRHMEVETGDCIVDVIEGTTGIDDQGNTGVALAFDGLIRQRFEIDGRFFTQKAIGAELAQNWDVKMADQRVTRTFLLGYMTGDNV